ncbi:MAG: acyl-CoA dehydrogenase family protein [Solirubrobacteraceae bacterium]
MTTASTRPTLSPELLQTLGELARTGEEGARLPDRAIAMLREAGLLRMAVAAQDGGDDLALPELLSVVTSLARTDGALGWACGQVALSQIMLGYLPAPARARIYADGPDVYAAGAAAPKGRAAKVGETWSISGRWPLVSGVSHATWVFLHCVEVDRARLRLGPDGRPCLRMVVLPANEITILPTWDSLGLRATGSHDVSVRAAGCEESWTAVLAESDPGPAASSRIDPPLVGGLFVAACALGIAHAALDAAVGLARAGKRGAFATTPLAEQPVFQHRLGDALMSLKAADALLATEIDRAARLAANTALAGLDGARLRAAAVGAVALCEEVTRTAFALGGSSSVYVRSPISRALRDVETAARHFAASRDHYLALGAELARSAAP